MKLNLMKKVEYIVAKEEIAHDEEFLPLKECFQKSAAAYAL